MAPYCLLSFSFNIFYQIYKIQRIGSFLILFLKIHTSDFEATVVCMRLSLLLTMSPTDFLDIHSCSFIQTMQMFFSNIHSLGVCFFPNVHLMLRVIWKISGTGNTAVFLLSIGITEFYIRQDEELISSAWMWDCSVLCFFQLGDNMLPECIAKLSKQRNNPSFFFIWFQLRSWNAEISSLQQDSNQPRNLN